jgi:hypothetical protein
MLSIIIGLVMLIGGLSGKLALKGTESGGALAVLGGVLIAWGVFRLVTAKRTAQK